MDLGYSRRDAEREAAEDQRAAAIWRSQGMTDADVNRALTKLRGIRDPFIVDAKGQLRPAAMGRSIIDAKRKNRKDV
jgi:hypothetical protein